MLSKNLPLQLLAEAVNTAMYLLNKTMCIQTPEATPYEIWNGRKPDLSHLRIFGSTAYMHVPKQFRKKLDAKAKKVILVGYQGESSNYRLFNPDTMRVSVSMNVTFNEKKVCCVSSVTKGECSIPSTDQEEAKENDGDERLTLPDDQAGNEVLAQVETARPPIEKQKLRDRSLVRSPKM